MLNGWRDTLEAGFPPGHLSFRRRDEEGTVGFRTRAPSDSKGIIISTRRQLLTRQLRRKVFSLKGPSADPEGNLRRGKKESGAR
jgi:hypothetical protein